MANMTGAQRDAFEAANTGQDFVATDVGALVIGVAFVLLLSWLAWVAISAYQSLRGHNVSAVDAGSKVARALFVVMVAFAIMTLE